MSVYLSVNIQTVYVLAAITVLIGAGTVFFLRTLDEHSTELLTRVSASLALTSTLLFVASTLMVEETLAIGLHIANFAVVFGVIAIAEITRQLMGLKPRTALVIALVVLAALIFQSLYDASKPLMGNAIRHSFESLIGLLLAARLAKVPRSNTPILKRLLMFTALLYSAEALVELASVLSSDFQLMRQGQNYALDVSQTVGIAGTSMLTGLFVALMMLTVNAQMANRLRDLLSTDELTKLSSRRSLNELGQDFVSRNEQSGTQIAVMMLDIDHFKRVNDRFGHPVGDAILRHCAKTMRASLRPEAMLARYGGEEFCALVPVDREDDAKAVAERLRQQVMHRPFGFAGFEIRSTVSIGVALSNPNKSLSVAISEADQALYLAKNSGRNKVVISGQPEPRQEPDWPTLLSSLPAQPSIVPI